MTVADTTAPTVTLTVPANGATVSGATVAVAATAVDLVGVAGVQFKLDGFNLGSEDTTSPYSTVWNSTTTTNGSHTLSAVARDAGGRTATASVTVTVNNITGSVDLTADGSQRFQNIAGFLVNANSAAWNNGQLAPALDLLIDQGVGVFRVIIDKQDWEATNDNADPNVFDWTYYNSIYTTPKFENLWSTIGYLNQKGITNGIMLNFMGPGPAWMGAPHITAGLEDEWAETIASLVYYAKVTRGLQFTLLGPANEVDWDGIEGPQVDQWQYALLLHKLAQKLDAIGLSDIRFVGPDTADINSGVNAYLPQLLADSVVMAKLQHFGFHNYADVAGGADAAIKGSAYPNRDYWVTEAGFGNDYYGPDHLMTQMKNGAASAGVWDAYTSAYNHRPNDGDPMIDLMSGTWVPEPSFYAFKQLFKFAQPGATRIGATGSASNLLALAFQNVATGQITVVGHNQTGGRTLKIAFSNLPVMSALQFYMTTTSRHFERQPDVTTVNSVATITVDTDAYFTLTASTTPDTTPPTVTMLAPGNGSTVSGSSVAVSAGASDNVAVAGVRFTLDGANLGAEVTTAPYTISWNSTSTPNGPHTLAAIARDTVGNTATSATVSVTVNNFIDTTAPTVSMTAPLNGATVSGAAFTVSANAADNVAVVGVQFRLDGAPLGAEDTVAPYSVSWNTTATPNGPHTLTAVARDAAGNSTTATAVSVTVNNVVDTTAPTVSMTAPANGATVSGTAVTVSATAADNVAVVGVQFLLDGAALGAEVTSAPYTIAWNTTSASAGAHTLTARARDAAGNQTTSTPVAVTVTGPPPGVLAIDVTAFGDQASKVSAVATGVFSTTSTNELLLAFISADDASGTGNTVVGVSGAGLTWALVVRSNAQKGTSEIWRAFAPAPLAGVAATATLAQPAASSITLVAFTGVDTTGTNGSGAIGATRSAGAASGASTATLTTTRAGSWVFGVGNDWDNATSRTVGAGQTLVHQYLPPVGDTFWVQRTNGPTAVSGTNVTINDTAPTGDHWNLSLCEIRPHP